MKKISKAFFILILTFSLIGCQKKQEILPKKSLESLIGLIVFQSTSSVANIGMKEEEALEILEDIKEEAIQTLEDTFKNLDLDISNENVEKIFNTQANILKNVVLSIEENEEDLKEKNEIRRVKITTNTLPISETLLNYSNEILQKLEAEEIKDETQFNDIFINTILNALNTVKPSQDTITFEIECIKQEISFDGKETEIWLPNDIEKFAQDLIDYIQE